MPRAVIPEIELILVEDDPDALAMLAAVVSDLGFCVRLARDGEEALALHRQRPAEVVLSDWSMPRMDGLALCKRLKAPEQRAQPYLMLMTAFDERSRMLEGMRAGADDFLRKPVDLDELEVRLVAAARLVAAQRALSERNEQLRRETERSFRSARTDALTGVVNRLQLREDLDAVAASATRVPCSLALLDIDHFKSFNDALGHLAGDDALRRVAGAIRDAIRASDTVYRFGGEEFVVLFPGLRAVEATRAAERVRAAVAALGIAHPGEARGGVVTVSAGVAELCAETVESWLSRADRALYRAKSAGRDRVLTALPDDTPAAAPRSAPPASPSLAR